MDQKDLYHHYNYNMAKQLQCNYKVQDKSIQ